MNKFTYLQLFGTLHSTKILSELELDGPLAINVARFMNKVGEELTIFNDVLKKLNVSYALLDDEGKPKVENNNYVIDPARLEEYNTKRQELFDTEVEFNISFGAGAFDNIKIKPADLRGLTPFIKDI